MPWEQRTALVTGASRGIGRAIALKLAQQGITVAVNYRGNDAAAQETQEIIRSHGGQCALYPADISNVDEAQSLVNSVIEDWGRLDILVNNAGITRDTLLLRMRTDDWEQVIATNLTGVFACTRAALRPMLKHKFGRIVTISSIAGILGNAGQANYAAAKAGVIGFMRSVAREVASRQITANVVAPGIIDTEMSQHMNQDAYDQLVRQVPLGRAGRPEDVADAVWFLVQADYITGQTLVVDGGLVMD
ncbi:3-oxoacyl-[acyl-carrier-protein] reductase [Sulfobacillus thermosulfidooxidans]|uniref:3-oxoacyl-[acyl-carrier-protein] reductase n=2 Tax=Sulfobacillus thermosulfidooxidans TaxID=28034 RepID=A0A1W1WMB9_SULTA|nr:3-oxoacyl-[acyl-carrier-protein] reductase [Sulfobacillus thermosulfidooxidans]OLZ09686.1 3-oxoacyl-[acyl-carrier-protein] reductase [Sulfobacillus thermosulfidooxidans]OLZ16007.1 3-oxoacyl-[acyl-carrier-protein] reductase [Sulfobacillus thermosulfidooxidans]OLZ18145.1 3-oxoacyl-[acyl-carrier-protein] reductase [Sulfobacillus thermosulfidooxidans]PSR29890.1 MAG: 3-oxoacyl-[acyl-carrier-protein] reductase [Sulfobacillus thermosulfidooxidans]SMC07396.1 3-oxoacyl-[acyl-carrier-protein] reducta